MQNETGNSRDFQISRQKGRVPFDQNFRKYRFKIEWNWNCPEIHFENFTSRGCPFFLEIWKFRKCPIPFGISTRYESAPVRLVVKSYQMAASLSSRHYTGCKMICHSSSLFVIENENEWNAIFHQAGPISFFSRLSTFPTKITRQNAEGSWWSGCLKCSKLLHVEKFNTHSE